MSKTGGGVGTNQHQIKGQGKQDLGKGLQATVDSLEGFGVPETPKFTFNTDSPIVSVTGLEPTSYDSAQSFYGKARVKHHADGSYTLQSYDTDVARISADQELIIGGVYSATTTRHTKEFVAQFAPRVRRESGMNIKQKDFDQFLRDED